ncbi:hypothetical protein [Streptomyces candidus]|uniref:Uncharacterized protein n=1 Tax=Streptomyces candidus TaxID=67283 RepID=A0A7X0HE43_9ACTN|nr:hypothetical protein [Streptomyces candidus]MBB6435925.1 hypothetical protein [Streptomyces candidus]GHH42991.1 hypothetical protein GCM10018773_28270 [Streptomyces candidus]
MTHEDDEALQDAVARCQAVERALEDAQRRYRRAQEASALAEAERVRTGRAAARAESTLAALLAQQEATVATLTAVLERQAPRRRLGARPSATGGRQEGPLAGPPGDPSDTDPHGTPHQVSPPR